MKADIYVKCGRVSHSGRPFALASLPISMAGIASALLC